MDELNYSNPLRKLGMRAKMEEGLEFTGEETTAELYRVALESRTADCAEALEAFLTMSMDEGEQVTNDKSYRMIRKSFDQMRKEGANAPELLHNLEDQMKTFLPKLDSYLAQRAKRRDMPNLNEYRTHRENMNRLLEIVSEINQELNRAPEREEIKEEPKPEEPKMEILKTEEPKMDEMKGTQQTVAEKYFNSFVNDNNIDFFTSLHERYPSSTADDLQMSVQILQYYKEGRTNLRQKGVDALPEFMEGLDRRIRDMRTEKLSKGGFSIGALRTFSDVRDNLSRIKNEMDPEHTTTFREVTDLRELLKNPRFKDDKALQEMYHKLGHVYNEESLYADNLADDGHIAGLYSLYEDVKEMAEKYVEQQKSKMFADKAETFIAEEVLKLSKQGLRQYQNVKQRRQDAWERREFDGVPTVAESKARLLDMETPLNLHDIINLMGSEEPGKNVNPKLIFPGDADVKSWNTSMDSLEKSFGAFVPVIQQMKTINKDPLMRIGFAQMLADGEIEKYRLTFKEGTTNPSIKNVESLSFKIPGKEELVRYAFEKNPEKCRDAMLKMKKQAPSPQNPAAEKWNELVEPALENLKKIGANPEANAEIWGQVKQNLNEMLAWNRKQPNKMRLMLAERNYIRDLVKMIPEDIAPTLSPTQPKPEVKEQPQPEVKQEPQPQVVEEPVIEEPAEGAVVEGPEDIYKNYKVSQPKVNPVLTIGTDSLTNLGKKPRTDADAFREALKNKRSSVADALSPQKLPYEPEPYKALRTTAQRLDGFGKPDAILDELERQAEELAKDENYHPLFREEAQKIMNIVREVNTSLHPERQIQQEPKPEVKEQPKPEVKQEPKPEVKQEPKVEEPKPEVKQAPQPKAPVHPLVEKANSYEKFMKMEANRSKGDEELQSLYRSMYTVAMGANRMVEAQKPEYEKSIQNAYKGLHDKAQKYLENHPRLGEDTTLLIQQVAELGEEGMRYTYQPQPEVKQEPQPEVKQEPQPEVKQEPQPEIKQEPQPEIKQEPQPEMKEDGPELLPLPQAEPDRTPELLEQNFKTLGGTEEGANLMRQLSDAVNTKDDISVDFLSGTGMKDVFWFVDKDVKTGETKLSPVFDGTKNPLEDPEGIKRLQESVKNSNLFIVNNKANYPYMVQVDEKTQKLSLPDIETEIKKPEKIGPQSNLVPMDGQEIQQPDPKLDEKLRQDAQSYADWYNTKVAPFMNEFHKDNLRPRAEKKYNFAQKAKTAVKECADVARTRREAEIEKQNKLLNDYMAVEDENARRVKEWQQNAEKAHILSDFEVVEMTTGDKLQSLNERMQGNKRFMTSNSELYENVLKAQAKVLENAEKFKNPTKAQQVEINRDMQRLKKASEKYLEERKAPKTDKGKARRAMVEENLKIVDEFAKKYPMSKHEMLIDNKFQRLRNESRAAVNKVQGLNVKRFMGWVHTEKVEMYQDYLNGTTSYERLNKKIKLMILSEHIKQNPKEMEKFKKLDALGVSKAADSVKLPEKLEQEIQKTIAEGGGQTLLEGFLVTDYAAELAKKCTVEIPEAKTTAKKTELNPPVKQGKNGPGMG